MAVNEPRQDPPPRLATNDYLVGHDLRDPDSRYMARVIGLCDRGIIVILGDNRFGKGTAERAKVWDNLTINRALLKTYGRKVRRA